MYYTKYRPQKFSEISKPNEVVDALMNQSKLSKFVHAYLFIGPRGTGKTTTARILAKALNCTNIDEHGDPCNTCESCTLIKTGNYMDLIEIDAASNRGIDDIRDLKEKIKLAPSHGNQKVYIIDEVHMLTTEAFNALLKTLEEPPIHAKFILCTTEFHKVPETIKSRCQVYKFKRATNSQLISKLKAITDSEGIDLKLDDLNKIAIASLGGFRDAETMLQQIVEGEMDVQNLLIGGDHNDFVYIVDCILSKDPTSSILRLNKLIDEGIDVYTWGTGLIKYLRDLLLIANDAHAGLVEVTEDLFAKMEDQASKFDSFNLAQIIEVFMTAHVEIKTSVLPQLPVEVAFVKVCNSKYSVFNFSEQPENEFNGSSNNVESQSKTTSETLKVKPPVKKNNPTNDLLDFSVIALSWEEVLKAISEKNSSITALLKSSKPIEIAEDRLILEVYYAFHKERIEATKNRQIIELALKTIYKVDLKVLCKVSPNKPKSLAKYETGDLTDYNVAVPANNNKDVSTDVFDGALPF